MGRRNTGKTTRLIDKSIQDLFKGKKLLFPTIGQLNKDFYKKGISVWNVNFESETGLTPVIDPDWGFGQVVIDDVLKSILRRLEYEHGIELIEYSKSNFGKVITIDNFKPI